MPAFDVVLVVAVVVAVVIVFVFVCHGGGDVCRCTGKLSHKHGIFI